MFILGIPVFAQGAEKAMEGLFKILSVGAIIVGLILIGLHYIWKSHKYFTSILLVLYAIPVMLFILVDLIDSLDSQYHSIWKDDLIGYLFPSLICAIAALRLSITYFIRKK